MTNFQVYKRTLSFSLLNFAVGLVSLAIFVGCCALGFVIGEPSDNGLLGIVIGFFIGIVAMVLISIFVSNRIKAAQISMMTRGVTSGDLPERTFKEGFNEIKGRFGKITVFYFITNAIKSIFRQIGRGFNKLGTAVGGDVGNGVTSAVDSAIQTLIGYLCDCCLGWILYRKEINAAKAGCEGAVIFFKSGKTLFRNIGRIFGMGLLSLLVIGGAFFGVSYLIFSQFPDVAVSLGKEIAAMSEEAPAFLTEPTVFMIAASAFIGIMMWSIIHSVLIRPFILVGVLRNYMATGLASIPTEQEINDLQSRYPRLGKLNKIN